MSEREEDMQLLFIHGWGMNSTIWQSTIDKLEEVPCKKIDLGFIKGGQTQELENKPTIVITHSLGTLYFLKSVLGKELMSENIKALIVIAGFTDFTSFTPLKTIEKMQEGVSSNPAAQMALFWRRAGCKNFAPSEALNPENLNEGLEWLGAWNAGVEAKALNCPKLILASKTDKIVPASAIEEQWLNSAVAGGQSKAPIKSAVASEPVSGGKPEGPSKNTSEAPIKNTKISWHETAPHCLQLAEPDWVASEIKQFLQAL